MSEVKQLINTTFFNPDRGWYLPLIGKLDQQQRDNYRNSPLFLLGNSISIKRKLIFELIQNVNQEMKIISKILKEDEIEVTQSIDMKKTYSFNRQHLYHLYSIIGQIEAILVELSSVVDLTIRYVQEFNKRVLGKKRKKQEVKNDLEQEGIDLGWLSSLDNIRNDFVHNYSAWIDFLKINNSYKFRISLPNELKKEYRKQYKKYQESVLDGDKIGDYFNKVDNFFSNSIDYLSRNISSKN